MITPAKDPAAHVAKFRKLYNEQDAKPTKARQRELDRMRAAGKKWDGEDCLYAMAFGEPVV